jgi:hypothetical protein
MALHIPFPNLSLHLSIALLFAAILLVTVPAAMLHAMDTIGPHMLPTAPEAGGPPSASAAAAAPPHAAETAASQAA